MWGGSSLRHEVFRAVWLAAICSYVGNWLQDVGENWLMTSLTTSPMLVALVTTSNTIPAFSLMLPAGVLADRVDRRKILIVAQSFLAFVAAVLAVLTFAKLASPTVILLASAGLGIGSAISTPSWQTLIPELVPRREIPEAVTLNSVAFNIARAVGPALAGLVLSATGPAAAFALNAFSFLAVIEVLRRYPEVKRISEKGAASRRREPFVGAMWSAVVYAKRTPGLRAIYGAVAAFSIMAATIPALLPAYAKWDLQTTERGYGLLLGALGAGAVFGALIVKRARGVMSARALVAGSMAIYGVSVIGMTFAPSLGTAVLLYFPAGIGWLCCFTTMNTLVQLTAPAWVRSRAMALYQLAFLSFWSIGASIGGALAKDVGTPTTMRVAAIGTLVAAAVTAMLKLPTFEEAHRAVADTSTPLPISVR